MKNKTRMQRVMQAAERMKGRGKISSDERKIRSDLAIDDRERDINNLATFMHNSKQEESET